MNLYGSGKIANVFEDLERAHNDPDVAATFCFVYLYNMRLEGTTRGCPRAVPYEKETQEFLIAFLPFRVS